MDNQDEHYDECPAAHDGNQPCHCEGINQADANYWAESEEDAEAARWPNS
jgi:hypothetical protein